MDNDGVSVSCNSSVHFHFWDFKIQDHVQFKFEKIEILQISFMMVVKLNSNIHKKKKTSKLLDRFISYYKNSFVLLF